jgi:plastocyanin
MKRVFASVLTPVAVAVLIAGCGSSSSSSSESKETSSSASSTAQAPATTSTSTATTSASSTAGSATTSLSLAANPEGQLKYDTTSLSAKAGKVSIDFTNSSPIPHNVTLESSSGAKVGNTPTFQGGSKTLTVNLKPGTYKFFCSVPGHRMAGMEGTLVVK